MRMDLYIHWDEFKTTWRQMSGAAATIVEQATVKLPPEPWDGVGIGGRDNVAGVSDGNGGFDDMVGVLYEYGGVVV